MDSKLPGDGYGAYGPGFNPRTDEANDGGIIRSNVVLDDGEIEEGNVPAAGREDLPLDWNTWLFFRSHIPCDNCMEAVTVNSAGVVAGSCGHSFCMACHDEYVVKGVVRPSQLLPCPLPSCGKKFSFQRNYVAHKTLSDCIRKMAEMDAGARVNTDRLLRVLSETKEYNLQRRMKADKELGDLKAAVESRDKRIKELEKVVAASGGCARKRNRMAISQNDREDKFDW